jgi:hypothetical protein
MRSAPRRYTQRGDQRRCKQSRKCDEQCTRCRVSSRLCPLCLCTSCSNRAHPGAAVTVSRCRKSWWRQHRTEEVARGPRGCRLARVLTGQPCTRHIGLRPNCYRRRQHARAPAHCTRAHRHRRGSLRCIVGALWPVFRDCGLHLLLRRRLPWGSQQRPLHMRSTWCSVQRHQGTELGQQWRLECGCRGNGYRLLHLCGRNV